MSSETARQPLIDAHAHVFPDALLTALAARGDYPRVDTSGALPVVEYSPHTSRQIDARLTDVNRTVADLAAQGIGRAVLAINIPGVDFFAPQQSVSVACAINDELAALVALHSGRLAAIAALPLPEPDVAAAELGRAKQLGLCGATIFSNVAGRGLDEPAYEVVFSEAARLGMPLYLHPTIPLSTAGLGAHGLVPTFGFPADTTVGVLRLVLGGIYERHPQLKLVVPHSLSLLPGLLGRVDYQAVHEPGAQGPLSGPPSEHLRLLYTDTVCASAPLLRFVIDFLGPDRVLFGSDYPFWDRATALATLEAAIGNHAEMDALGWRNACRIFGLTEPGVSPTAQ